MRFQKDISLSGGLVGATMEEIQTEEGCETRREYLLVGSTAASMPLMVSHPSSAWFFVPLLNGVN
ncbi:hypothetical protein [Cellvibrio sp. PSBB006]|uniref:hypothetical protein n=1 Tax=Cellvibrio sp. PSBB006 TaxID=1987723 RepID=UPI000B3B6FED|nr:hypothetical protein [Cellvibrio sp. PSBB006]ARU26210.1 hypothetical protein CBR65_01490 [Cellvibrio sp. PSBB006]